MGEGRGPSPIPRSRPRFQAEAHSRPPSVVSVQLFVFVEFVFDRSVGRSVESAGEKSRVESERVKKGIDG